MNLADRLLKRVGEILADDSARKGFFSAFSRWARRILLGATLGYALLILVLILVFRWIGERNLTVAFLLYLPRQVFLIPVVGLFPLAVLFHRWSAFALLVCSVWFALGTMDLRLRRAPAPFRSNPETTLVVLTYNRGQHANQSLQPFKNHIRPDLLLLQEASRRADRYRVAEGYGEFPHAIDVSEHTLLSRHPILGAEIVPAEPGSGSPPISARFTIDFAGKPVAVYSVHVRSPRDTLLYYRRGSFLYGLIGLPGTPFAERRRENQRFWDKRIREARHLAEQIEADPLPVIVAGDFNAPAGGYIHGILESRFQDAHLESGHGFGHTFPGTTRNPLSLGGPWIRIDYLFCNDAWSPGWCITETDRPSQHRAVAAMFRLR